MSTIAVEMAAIKSELLALGCPVLNMGGREITLEDLERAAEYCVEANPWSGMLNGRSAHEDAVRLLDRVRRLASLQPKSPEVERTMGTVHYMQTHVSVSAEQDAVDRFRCGTAIEREQARAELIHLLGNVRDLTGPLRGLLVDLLRDAEPKRTSGAPSIHRDQIDLIAFAHGSGLSLNRCYRLVAMLWPEDCYNEELLRESLRKSFARARKTRRAEIEAKIADGKDCPGYGLRELRRLEHKQELRRLGKTPRLR